MTNASIAFEEALKEDLLDLAKNNKDFDIAVFVHRGFDDVVNENILGNYNLLYSGFAIMFVYVLVMLGKFNCVEQRVWLSVAGMKSQNIFSRVFLSVSGDHKGSTHFDNPNILHLVLFLDLSSVSFQVFHTPFEWD